ncbi:hypothetical protein CASFOL_008267 [Castilleja foliolosa]|uniref:Agenet domain-containing protein n=1 Tax=Castilleja foliolosa TaxID=1961234 RepID=A0ABD3E2H5_9LAMI
MEGGYTPMEYNDNDYEGHNLHLTGEECSKSSSVLRPFALPKFDFDDNLQGHLRFDSLVENEVFLGIQSQEDNQWIEDFSRGGSAIAFSSSAAESCALPRHINVWSEATSSESVEMLLKAVGQEEMVPGENLMEESEPGDQPGNSIRGMENIGQDSKIDDDIDHGNSLLPPAEVEGDISRSNQSAGVEDVQSEYAVQSGETNVSVYGLCADSNGASLTENSENSEIKVKRTSDNQVGTFGLVNESLSTHMQENVPVSCTELGVDKSETSSQNVAVSVKESIDQDKISDISFVSSSCVTKDIAHSVAEHEEGCKKVLGRDAIETDRTEMHCSRKTPSEMEPSKEEHSVKMCVPNSEEASSMPQIGESVSTEVAFVVEPTGSSHPGTAVLSSDTETEQFSEGRSILHEKSSISLQGEGIGGLEVEGSDAVTSSIVGNTEPKQAPVIQSSDQNSPVGSEDNRPECHSSFEAPCASPSDKVCESNHGDGPVNAEGSTIEGESCVKKSVIDDMSDAVGTAVEKENVEDGDHVVPPLVSTIDIISMPLDACEDDLDVPVHERDVKNLPFDSNDGVCGESEKEVPTSSAEGVQVDTTTVSLPNSPAGDYPALNTEVEDTKLTSSCVDSDELVDGNKHNIRSCDIAFRDQSKGTESEAAKQQLSSASKESLESNELTVAVETEQGSLLDSDSGEAHTQTSSQSNFLVEMSSVAMPDEGHKELREKMEDSSNDFIVQDDGAEAAPNEKPMEAELGRKSGANSSSVLDKVLQHFFICIETRYGLLRSIVANFAGHVECEVASCTVEMDKSNQVAPPDISFTDLSQSVINSRASLRRVDAENNAEVFTTSKDDGTFTFDIRPLGGQSTGDSGKGSQSFHRIQACKLSLTGEGSPSSSSSQTDPVEVKEGSHVSSLTTPSGGVRSSSERKPKRSSSKSGKASANKGNLVKEKTPLRQTVKWDKSSQFLSPLGAGQLVTFESTVKPRGPVSIPTSSLPDLNTSAPTTAFFQQPFTDLQQLQLRAQIFVYGSLIQGAAPDEACMISAFGMSVWELSWHSCVDRFHSQKSQGKNTETPVSVRPGSKAPDQTKRQGFSQSEALTSVGGRASKKAIPSPVVNPMISLSSPLWNTSTSSAEALPPSTSSMARSAVIDYQAVSPLNPYQTPPIRNYATHTTWSSQAPFPVPWLAPTQTSSYDIGTIPAFPVTPSKESSLAAICSTKHVSSIPTKTHTRASTTFAGASSLDLEKLKVSTGQTADAKIRKRKKSSGAEDAVRVLVTATPVDTVSVPVISSQLSNKGPAVEDLSQLSLIAQNQGVQMPTPVVGSHYSTSVAVETPSSLLHKGTTNQFFSMVSPAITSDQFKGGDLSIDKRALNIECLSKVEEAKLQAQEAAAHAAATISQCEGVWSQLDQQNNSGLTSDAQSKLASAAVAIAAAVSVAKAAAAAAKIASTAALQAKQMADEAVAESGTINPSGHDAIFVSNSMNLAIASPVSIFRGGDRNNMSSLAISAAREASKRRIEAASAATRHAENLDAIVKAAELAAEAVSHAGKIVAMGEPFSLSELAKAGPNSYWKVSKVGVDKNKNIYSTSNAGEVPEVYVNQHNAPDKDMRVMSDVVSPIQELSRNMVDDHVIVEENIMASGKNGGNFNTQKDKKVSDSANIVVSDLGMKSRSTSYALSSIKEGSYVEVLKDRGDLKKAWFSANVLSLKDGGAVVSYTDLQPDGGSEQLKEWISIEANDDETPKVRIPHPMTAVQLEGTRKRRRAAAKDYTWSVGDKVDAWVQDCWREGIIAEKEKNEATTLSVHFPAQGETLLVKVWHLRPTLIWNDGQWIEWCGPGQDPTSQGDTPAEKRPKLGGSGSIEAKNMDLAVMGRNEGPRLPLSADEKTFSIGSTREENKPNTVKTSMRSGTEKEGSRVVFGVPKPGKKRKYMDVSKHYVSDRVTKTNVSNDSMKLAKALAPHGSGTQGFKNKSKFDLKEKQVVESRPRAIKSGKPPSIIPSKSLTWKDDSTSSRHNARNGGVSDTGKGSISNDENESGEQNRAGFGSSSNVEETSVGSTVFSSQALPKDNRKKTATRSIKPQRLNQGKPALVAGKSAKNEAPETSVSGASEPRRSNRRILPTSRMLEGLQSSLLIPKYPSSSHEKSHKPPHNKGTTKGNNNRG